MEISKNKSMKTTMQHLPSTKNGLPSKQSWYPQWCGRK